jgi:hypothetical protein
MCRKLICLLSIIFMLTLASTTYGVDVVIGDFEGSMDNWAAGWEGSPVLTNDTNGVTLGSQSLSVQWTGKYWVLQWNAPTVPRLKTGTTLKFDVTAYGSDFANWAKVADKIALNSDGPSGWKEYDNLTTAVERATGLSTGLDFGSWSGTVERTYSLDISDYDATGATFFQINISMQVDPEDGTGRVYIDNVQLLGLKPKPACCPKIIYVTDVPDRNSDGIYDDQSFIDWLVNEGYNVDARRGYWKELDPNKIAELEAADLVLISRGTDTGQYNQAPEPTQWNSLTTPILCINVWQIRNNRFKWLNNPTDAKKDAGSPLMWVLEPSHCIFSGVALDPDGLVEVLDPNVEGSVNTSFIDMTDVGNGKLLAQSLGIYNAAWIVEWDAGVEYYDGAGEFAGGKRMLFSAGTQDGPVQGAFNLNAEGQKLLRNIIAYLAPCKTACLVHSYTFEDGTANDSVGDADGILMGDAFVDSGSLFLDGDGDWMDMPGDVIAMNTYPEVTIEAWFTPEAGGNTGFHMLAAFGEEGTGAADWAGYKYLFMTPARGDDVSRAAIQTYSMDDSPWDEETGVSDVIEHDDGLQHHFVCTVNATDLAFYIDGVLIGTAALDPGNEIAGIGTAVARLGKGVYPADPLWMGTIEEFNIYNCALTACEIEAKYAAGPTKPVQIPVENFSFELPGTGKQKCWDGENLNTETADDPNDYFTDVPGWSSDTPASDSGVEGPDAWPGHTEGVWAAFMMGTDPSTYNLTDYVIQCGDDLVLYVDSRDNWTADAAKPTQLQITLYYEAGGRVPAATATVELTETWTTFSVELKADDVPACVGNKVGIELKNASNATTDNNSWIGLDNVILINMRG